MKQPYTKHIERSIKSLQVGGSIFAFPRSKPKLYYYEALLGVAIFPVAAFAAVTGGVLGFLDMLTSFVTAIVPILVGCAVVVFFWGVVKFIAHAGDEKAIEEGKQLMLWGLVGIFVIVALWSIVGYVQSSLGLDLSTPASTAPSVPIVIPAT